MYTCGQWLDVSCILESDYCCLFIPLFLHFPFSPIFKHLHICQTFLRNCEAYINWYTRGHRLDVLCIPKSDCCCLLIPLFHCSFSPIFNYNNFRHTFLANYGAYKVETWYTRGQRLDVLCIPKSLLLHMCPFISSFSPIFKH